LEAERQVLEVVYGISEDRVSVVPLGLDKPFLEWGKGNHDANYLICVGTITYQKNTIELAKLARMACVPILFVGKPYATTDPCWIEFTSLVDGQWVRHEPHVANPARMLDLLKSARGAVMMSDFENWCFAAHEAAACGLPLLVQDQKWSRERFGNQVRYFKKIGCCPENIATLKRFYEDSSRLSPPRIKFFSWHDVAIRLKGVYEKVLNEKPKG
jgi:glycosyltransferase involved in cell wall biosynthesis